MATMTLSPQPAPEAGQLPPLKKRKAGCWHAILPALLMACGIVFLVTGARSHDDLSLPIALIYLLFGQWELRQWWLRRTQPQIAFEPWHRDNPRMLRLQNVRQYTQLAMIPYFLVILLLYIFHNTHKHWIGSLYIFIPIFLDNAVVSQIRQHNPPPQPLPLDPVNWSELKPIKSENWGTTNHPSGLL